ncbi:MAG: GTPase ObgE [Cryomorphaceae bacterium]|jgi:GTP-binding protein|nr:GTPase ObgE [Cryomorphaceae bacterium]MDG1889176.1 GTPase ObgE [Flavobacteriaceae bacterium]MBT3503314.1 GTPase ObgE [Cryomorphaceae bacterium]MBT3689664.1 GTPase ObgE [Cryomorphaceae bacterium]MBT4221777.1 GTPase ObgE [Cryomorphaceae bacterium]|tara:strand:+ start:569 stop:1576 length:1008 start_codon:yes stop_codon:yes gene_type:complete
MIVDNFVDYVKLTVRSGKGGRGSTHLRREKYVPKGGPDGGDGGDGGNIIIRGNSNLWTLQSFRFKKHFKAGSGGDGGGSRKSGISGEDIIIDVPLGTIIKDTNSDNIFFEINDEKSETTLLKGGKGGRGNFHFKSPTNQTPRYSQAGLPGQEIQITLELKVLADVGLVGYPNAGKSTLLSVLSDAKPKIADYEFTTLKPNLGIVAMSDYRSFVMADIPGIIEGASEGRGLGHHFLRHIERNSILLYIIPVDTKNVKKDFNILQKELTKYNPELADKDFMIAFSKCDLMDNELLEEFKVILKKEFKSIPFLIISSINTFGILGLKEELWKMLNKNS